MLSRIPTLCISAAAVLALAAPAPVSADHYSNRADRVHGQVTDVDYQKHALTVQTPTGAESYMVSELSRVFSSDGETTFDHLIPGMYVSVRVRADEEPVKWADFITIIDPEALDGTLSTLPPVGAADTATVKKVDAKAGILHVESTNGPEQYRINDATKILSGVRTLEPSELQAGRRVAVTAKRDGEDYVATRIMVVAAGPEKLAPNSASN